MPTPINNNIWMRIKNFIDKDLLLVGGGICVCILLIYHSYQVQHEQEIWPMPSIAKETINGVHNPLRIKEFIYRYGTYDKELMEADYSYESCSVDLYTLLEPLPQGDIKQYLQQFDDKDLKSARAADKDRLFIIKGQSIQTTWMQLHELKPSIFNPFDRSLQEKEKLGQTIDLDKQKKYSFFLRCLDFIKDTTLPYKEKALVKRYNWHFYETFKNTKAQREYNQQIVISALSDPGSLLRMRGSCSRNDIEFYSPHYKIYFVISSDLGYLSNNPNPACR